MNNVGSFMATGCMHLNKQHQILDPLKRVKFDLAIAEVCDVCAFG